MPLSALVGSLRWRRSRGRIFCGLGLLGWLGLGGGLAGCHSLQKAGNDAAVVGGVATMVALSPLVPVVDGARHLGGTKERREADFAAVRARLDPLAEQRIVAVQQHDPIADATALYRAGVISFLAVAPGRTEYPGLFGPDYDLSRVAVTPGGAGASPLFQSLEELLDPFPRDLAVREGEVPYVSSTLDRFRDLTRAFKVEFNREMYRLARPN